VVGLDVRERLVAAVAWVDVEYDQPALATGSDRDV
jgi:hypothetical protein